MELFALGHGDGYTETDVREGARALTGWRIEPDQASAVLRPRLHDQGSKTVLGVTGNLDQVGFGDAVLARPASAGHVCGPLVRPAGVRHATGRGHPGPAGHRLWQQARPGRDVPRHLYRSAVSPRRQQIVIGRWNG